MADLSRKDIITLADRTLAHLAEQGTYAWVYFKYTCGTCGARVVLAERNTLREAGECCECGSVTPIVEAGFLLCMAGAPPTKES